MKNIGGFVIKCLVVVVLYFFLNGWFTAQSQVMYTYDGNGNRLTRSITLKKSATAIDSIYENEAENEVFKDKIGETQIRIFPNPTKGNLAIELLGESTEVKIDYTVYNSSGKILKSKKTSEQKFNIDFTNYPSGIYILKLSIDGEVSEWKIIKE
jgi:hypothetical protein